MNLPDSRARLQTNKSSKKKSFLNGKWATWFDVDGAGTNVTLFFRKEIVFWNKKDGVLNSLSRK